MSLRKKKGEGPLHPQPEGWGIRDPPHSLCNNPTTHDIITYSNKALRHKRVYPYLRYGLISYNISKIPGRFFLHNESMDFCLALKDYLKNQDGELLNQEGISMLKNLIADELETSKLLEAILFNKHNYNYFRTNIEFKNLTGKS